MATFEDAVLEQLTELVSAVKAKKTIVPIFVFLPSTIRADQMHHLAEMMGNELRKAGFDLLPEGVNEGG